MKLWRLLLLVVAIVALVWIVRSTPPAKQEMVPFKCMERPAAAASTTPSFGHLDGVDITPSGGVQETLKVSGSGESSKRLIASIKERLSVVDPTFKDLDIRESESGSYTEDKKMIFICLRDEHGRDYSMNTLVYVTLHELAHLLNHKNYGHTPEFNKLFNSLLCKASSVNVYDPNTVHDDWYCGVDIRGITPPTCDYVEHFSVDQLDLKTDPMELSALPDGEESL